MSGLQFLLLGLTCIVFIGLAALAGLASLAYETGAAGVLKCSVWSLRPYCCITPLMRYVTLLAALSWTICSRASFATGRLEAITPFVLNSSGLRIAGEIHALNRNRCIAVIAVGGSSVRTRADTGVAVRLFLDDQAAVVLMDRRGNGLSTGRFEVPDTRNTKWQIPRFGHDVAAVARHLKGLGFRRVAIVGTSMGGWINDSAAVLAPNAIDAVVSINGGASTVGVSDKFDDLASSGLTLAEAADRARSYRGPQGYDPRRDLKRIRQPVLWVFAAKDSSNPSMLDLSNVKRMARRGKAFKWLILPNADHELVDSTTHKFDASWIQPVRSFIHDRARCPAPRRRTRALQRALSPNSL
jgi:pimeloyl-ACP methyl ester carboxylesterase